MTETFGIDVSHHNGRIDWQKVKACGKSFTLMKCQYESKAHRKDETFDFNYTESGKQKMKRGVYIYLAAEAIKNPVGDAESLLKNLGGRTLELGIWLDLEDKVLKDKGFNYIKNVSKIYANIFKKAGYFVGIYCNKDWYQHYIDKELKDSFKFWIARYPKDDYGLYNAGSALRPRTENVMMWQYSSKGRVDGIQGNVDLNVLFYDINKNVDNIKQKNDKKSANPFVLTKDFLKIGSTGESVKWLQYELNRHGASLKIDGIYGQKTKEALIKYQKENKLKIDGIFGTETKKSLWSKL